MGTSRSVACVEAIARSSMISDDAHATDTDLEVTDLRPMSRRSTGEKA
jgi:hypothetical protein